jgi:small multidrug resistance family-3 protein
MTSIALPLIIAAALEVGGDAAIRRGLVQSGWPHVALGALMLVAYGLIVNLNRSIDFGRLMGLYIAMFFLVSQVVSVALFAERLSLSLIVGGALVVAGALVIQMGMR